MNPPIIVKLVFNHNNQAIVRDNVNYFLYDEKNGKECLTLGFEDGTVGDFPLDDIFSFTVIPKNYLTK